MIDVWWVAANSLWLVGLALVLATLSWGTWVSARTGQRWRAVLGAPPLRRWLDAGAVLFWGGMALSAPSWVRRGLWGLVAVVWLASTLTKQGEGTRGDNRPEI